jgi:hypothetical protein
VLGSLPSGADSVQVDGRMVRITAGPIGAAQKKAGKTYLPGLCAL